MLHTRPGSASGMQGQNQPYGGNQPQRNSYYGGSGGQQVYRMNPGPIQPYAFTSTPTLHSNNQWQHPATYRTASSPAVPTMRAFSGSGSQQQQQQRGRYPGSVSMTNLPSSSYADYGAGSRDDSSLPAVGGRRYPSAPRPQSAHLIGATTATATQVTFTQATPVRLSPERYRRPAPRIVDVPAGAAGRQQLPPPQFGDQRLAVPRNRTPSNTNRPNSFYSSTTASSTDDFQAYRHQLPDEQKRLRRRSMPALDSAEYRRPFTPQGAGQSGEMTGQKGPDFPQTQSRLAPSHGGNTNTASLPSSNGSSESLTSNRSNGSHPSVSCAIQALITHAWHLSLLHYIYPCHISCIVQ